MIGSGADIKVYESKPATAWLWAAACIGVGLILLWSFGHQRKDQFLLDGVVLAGVILGAVYYANMARHPPRLHVQSQALVLERAGKPPLILPWDHIDSFVVVRRRGLSLLGYRLRKGAAKPPFAPLFRLFEGADAVLYGFWPTQAKDMAADLTAHLNQLRNPNAPLDLNKDIISAPSSTPNPAPVYTQPPKQAAVARAPPAVSEPRRWFGPKPKADETGNKPIVW